jgi:hypothetical protein
MRGVIREKTVVWFGIITQQTIRRGSFRNARKWHATADSILAKRGRLYKLISGTAH